MINFTLALIITSSLSIVAGAVVAIPKSVRLIIPVTLKPATVFLSIGFTIVFPTTSNVTGFVIPCNDRSPSTF